jgi:TetR/AcrR family transcriptional regulator
MSVKEKENTETKILEAARDVFQQKGFDGARMQEIADAAHINKGLLHYYFKTKDALFERVFGYAFEVLTKRISDVLNADEPLFVKIDQFCAAYIGMVARNSYLPRFVFNELSKNPNKFIVRFQRHHPMPEMRTFYDQVAHETAMGRIRHIDPRQLLVNMMSLAVFPFLAEPMIRMIHHMTQREFDTFVEARKTEVAVFIINAIRLDQ